MVKEKIENLKEVRRFINRVKKKINIDKVILFGSFVEGKQREWSDIDLAIVSDDFSKMSFHQRLVFLGMLAWQAKVTEIEALGYTLDEYKNATKLDFLGEIKRTGEIIYEK
ncbi:MAG: nucleotidyltransferase domain-containing protein [candidate division Zixibacteria bacterium]|nr:nucleotidyltransferase domain-containing protein [candidate division Zixibacteria bacterium]